MTLRESGARMIAPIQSDYRNSIDLTCAKREYPPRVAPGIIGVGATFCEPVECDQGPQQRFHLLQRNHVRPVGRRLVRILMRLDEHAGDADRDGGARQHRNEFALAARRRALPARLLHRMRGVENHRRAGLPQAAAARACR